jgi:hypothetical protein
MNIIEAMADPQLFGQSFAPSLLWGDTWRFWRVWLKALYGIPLTTTAEKSIYTRHTGRDPQDYQLEPYREAFNICGRKAGKTKIDSLVITYSAVFGDHASSLKSGATVVCQAIATDTRQASILIGYCKKLLHDSPLLSSLIESESSDTIVLTSGVRIEVYAASFRAVRGYVVPCVVLDEMAFLRSDESANPDSEIIAASTPNQLTCAQPLLLGSSSPYAKRGELYKAYKDFFGIAGAKVLVWKAATREMNPSNPVILAALIARAYLRDSAKADAEYGGNFRSDAESFLPLEEIEACITKGVRSRPYQRGIQYHFFTDANAGGADEFTLACAHFDDRSQRVVVDLIEGRHGNPEVIAVEFSEIIKSYHASEVTGDNFAKDWVSGAFEKQGVTYHRSERNRSEVYMELLPRIKSQTVELPDDTTTTTQFADLERSPGRQRDVVDHPRGGHDDRSNSVAGAVVLAFQLGGTLGVLDYFSSGMAQQELTRLSAGAQLRPAQKKPEPVVSKNCPRCHATGNIRELSYGGELRCGDCGSQWWPHGEPVVFRGGNRRGM